MNSTGNTFIVDETPLLKNLSINKNCYWTEKNIKNTCNIHSVDGLAILFPNSAHHLQWQFFNADGSLSDMCGNLARGLIYYLSKKFPNHKTAFSLLGPNNIIQKGYVKNNIPFLSMPKGEKITFSSNVNLQEIYSKAILKNIPEIYTTINYISMGVPHALIPIYPDALNLSKKFINFFNNTANFNNTKNLEPTNLESINLKQTPASLTDYTIKNLPKNLQTFIQKNRNQNAQGFNVSLFNPNTLQTISFERGVENFTLSCGTGACALAYYLKTSVPLYKNHKEIIIPMPGGELFINVDKKKYLLGGKCKILNMDLV